MNHNWFNAALLIQILRLLTKCSLRSFHFGGQAQLSQMRKHLKNPLCHSLSHSVTISLKKSKSHINQTNEIRSTWNFQDNFIMVCPDDPGTQRRPHSPRLNAVKDDLILQDSSQESSLSSKYDSLDVTLAKKSYYACSGIFSGFVNTSISWWSMLLRMTSSSKTLVKNHQCLAEKDLEDGGFVTHF